MNLAKLKQLVGNAIIPSSGVAFVLWLAFGTLWWTIPVSIVLGSGLTLIISKPKEPLALNEQKLLALEEAKLDRELQTLK